MKVIQQDWSKIRNQLQNKKQGSNEAKHSEIDISLKLDEMHWVDTESIFFTSIKQIFQVKLQT